MFNRLCIIGVGLIGGSIALAARERGLCQTVAGYGREEGIANLQKAKQLNVIDDYYLDIRQAVDGADYIVIATPVGCADKIFSGLKDCWSDRAIYTDVGSTKGSVIDAAKNVFGRVPANFIPAHPIAGAEKSGV
ncbi:MAG: prephenate dehydrogenase, partial [Gammaproteobacteria bacterium]